MSYKTIGVWILLFGVMGLSFFAIDHFFFDPWPEFTLGAMFIIFLRIPADILLDWAKK